MDRGPRLLIFDVDKTLVRTRSGEADRRARPGWTAEADWEWIPGVLERIHELRAADPGLAIALATNQGGPAMGFQDQVMLRSEIDRVAADIGGDVFVSIAWGMPDAVVPELRYTDPLRKPSPGSLVAAMRHFGVDSDATLMVGDSAADRAAALAVNCHFMWAHEFFAGPAMFPPPAADFGLA